MPPGEKRYEGAATGNDVPSGWARRPAAVALILALGLTVATPAALAAESRYSKWSDPDTEAAKAATDV